MSDSDSSDSQYSVEGEWGEFLFKLITPIDYPSVLKHVPEVFCRTEPLISAVGYTQEFGDDFCASVKNSLDKKNGLSFMALHRTSGKLAGIRVTHKNKKETHDRDLDRKLKSKTTELLSLNIREITHEANVFEKYAVDHYAELGILSVDPEFRELGLATEMYRRSLTLLKSRGYKITVSNFTSPFTRKVATKFGFEEVVRRYFKDFYDEEGNPFIYNAQDDQFCAYMVKIL